VFTRRDRVRQVVDLVWARAEAAACELLLEMRLYLLDRTPEQHLDGGVDARLQGFALMRDLVVI
jgi:hypothetical protein